MKFQHKSLRETQSVQHPPKPVRLHSTPQVTVVGPVGKMIPNIYPFKPVPHFLLLLLCPRTNYINGCLCHLAPEGNNGRAWRKGKGQGISPDWTLFLNGGWGVDCICQDKVTAPIQVAPAIWLILGSCYHRFKLVTTLWCYYSRDIMKAPWFPRPC